MDRFPLVIDRLSAWVGKAFAWCILVLTLAYVYEVFVRKALRDPTAWAFDISYTMYGALFMMAGAYTLARDGHVRGDVLFRLWRPKVQATVELTLYIVFFFPGILALIIAGADYAAESWSYNYGTGEVSINSPANVPISQFKTVLPVAAVLLFVQGLAQVCRCIVCLKTGVWPEHLEDVEELELVLAKEHQEREEEEQRRAAAAGQGGA